MRRFSMHSRILFGMVAWLLGAATATAGSLLAVSLLGQGITGGSRELMTQDAVNNELASAAAESSPSASAIVTPSARPSPTEATPTPAPAATSASPVPGPTTATASPVATSDSPTVSTGGTVLTSSGGQVLAACQATGAYLISWSPLQGYEVAGVSRGPAATARVTFESTANRVTMAVSCSAGVPSAATTVRPGDE
jgi:serine/threonine-protein kinase